MLQNLYYKYSYFQMVYLLEELNQVHILIKSHKVNLLHFYQILYFQLHLKGLFLSFQNHYPTILYLNYQVLEL